MHKYCVKENYTIKETIEKFEADNDRVAIVVNDAEQVVGVVSQGDILRALSSGVGMYTQINKIISNSFLHLYEKDMEVALKMFRKKKLSLLPIINKDNTLADVIVINDIYDYLGVKE